MTTEEGTPKPGPPAEEMEILSQRLLAEFARSGPYWRHVAARELHTAYRLGYTAGLGAATELRAALEDIAAFGLRTDCNPTMNGQRPWGYGEWSRYMSQADAWLRERARAALRATTTEVQP